jgi:CHAD domain-containing protein
MASRSFKLRQGEPVPRGIARIARGRIDHAVDELEGRTDSSPEKAVHEARKDMKKLRAVVRLVRGEIGHHVYRRENATFRDAGQELSGVRDADVMLATLAKLEYDIPAATTRDLHEALEAHKARTAGGTREQASVHVVEALTTARRRIGRWPLDQDGFEAVSGGLERIYRQGRRGFRDARAEPTTENLHEWRKRVKDLWYHLTILRAAWPPVMDALADEAHRLSEHIGDDHDLSVLLAWAEEHAPASGAAIEGPVGQRRAELQADAFETGARLYAEKPREFVRQVERWWGSAAYVPPPLPVPSQRAGASRGRPSSLPW